MRQLIQKGMPIGIPLISTAGFLGLDNHDHLLAKPSATAEADGYHTWDKEWDG